ncbi:MULTISPECIES: cytochrome b6-f complex subunit PetL [unclassified Coleofasciculus]|nr:MULTISPECIES: cytochrome b6-f complex subunit PetL [unclassified Coleofasciculus]MBE9124606.1 cytochrome b6-f complex subunit PetL [Coleofasciculus sp. LEGE 07081]MBE9147570.1 cytochrome b6-f complex subunit PetL [Coleofasciculus sp. LEGE 07092]
MSVSGIIAYFLILGAASAVALALFFGLRAVKLI